MPNNNDAYVYPNRVARRPAAVHDAHTRPCFVFDSYQSRLPEKPGGVAVFKDRAQGIKREFVTP